MHLGHQLESNEGYKLSIWYLKSLCWMECIACIMRDSVVYKTSNLLLWSVYFSILYNLTITWYSVHHLYMYLWPLKTKLIIALNIWLQIVSFFYIFEKLKNGWYDVVSAVVIAKNLGRRCIYTCRPKMLFQKIIWENLTYDQQRNS